MTHHDEYSGSNEFIVVVIAAAVVVARLGTLTGLDVIMSIASAVIVVIRQEYC